MRHGPGDALVESRILCLSAHSVTVILSGGLSEFSASSSQSGFSCTAFPAFRRDIDFTVGHSGERVIDDFSQLSF